MMLQTRKMARLSLARAFRFLYHGRTVFAGGRDDRLVKVAPLWAMIGDRRGFLNSAVREEELRDLREQGRTGRPLGSATFPERLEAIAGRVLKPQKGGRPPMLSKSILRKLP
jgi:hypothetical protein